MLGTSVNVAMRRQRQAVDTRRQWRSVFKNYPNNEVLLRMVQGPATQEPVGRALGLVPLERKTLSRNQNQHHEKQMECLRPLSDIRRPTWIGEL